MPDYDSHGDMLRELGIEDTRANAERLFVRAELSPANGDEFSPIDTWVFKVDQDMRPDWFVESYEEGRMRDAVKKWAKEHIHIGVDGLKIRAGSNHYIKDCTDVEIYGNSTIKNVYDNSTIEYVYDNSTIKYVYGNSTIKNVHGNSTIISSLYSDWNNKDKFILSENATFKDNRTKTIYQSGDWKLQIVKDGTIS